jgi:uncharacterized protein (TIGR02284 family)
MTEVRNTVAKLIETCKDGEEGYRQAAENIKNSEYKSFFEQQSAERGRFASELQVHLPVESKDSGSVAGAVHRVWIDLKSKLGAGDEAILSSVEQGEDNAKETYEEALKDALPSELVSIVQRQYQRVKAAHDRVKALRDLNKAA